MDSLNMEILQGVHLAVRQKLVDYVHVTGVRRPLFDKIGREILTKISPSTGQWLMFKSNGKTLVSATPTSTYLQLKQNVSKFFMSSPNVN